MRRSLIRTDADEVTYNLHVMLRFDLELDLLEGKLAVRDLPEAWRERFEADLGIAPPDDRDGVLAGRALVRGRDRRRVPGLYAGQHPERPVLRGRARRPTPRSRPRSSRGSLTRCTPGWWRTSTGTAANTRPTS